MTGALRFPFGIADRGAARSVPREEQIGQQLEQLLFTIAGERVDRPAFGCGVQRLVFEGASPTSAATAEYTISINIRRYMTDIIILDAVRVTTDDTTLYVDILYTIVETMEERAFSASRPLEGPA